MGIATLLENPIASPADFDRWSFANMASHRDIIRRIFETNGTELPEYVLSPFDPTNMDAWLELHQQMHTDFQGILGISGYDLTVLDWNDESQVSTWLAQHANTHWIASQVLGIG
jgi:hypothetical protein